MKLRPSGQDHLGTAWTLTAVMETWPPAQGHPSLQAAPEVGRGRTDPLLPRSCLFSAPRTRPRTALPGCCDFRTMSHPCPGRRPGHGCAYLYQPLGRRASQSPQMPARERRVRARSSPGAVVNRTLTSAPGTQEAALGRFQARQGCRDLSHSPHVGQLLVCGHIRPVLHWENHDTWVSKDMGAQRGPAMWGAATGNLGASWQCQHQEHSPAGPGMKDKAESSMSPPTAGAGPQPAGGKKDYGTPPATTQTT